MQRKKSALLLIDLQNDFCHPEGTASKRGKHVAALQEKVENMKDLLEAARNSDIPVIHVISEHSSWTESPSGKERFGRSSQDSKLTYCEPGSWGAEIYPPFTPQPGEQVMIKHRYSAFVHTNLEFILKRHGMEHISLIGAYTNVCIDSTARDAYMRDFSVTIPYDGVVSDNETLHDYALELLQGTFADVVPASEIIKQWQLWKERGHERNLIYRSGHGD